MRTQPGMHLPEGPENKKWWPSQNFRCIIITWKSFYFWYYANMCVFFSLYTVTWTLCIQPDILMGSADTADLKLLRDRKLVRDRYQRYCNFFFSCRFRPHSWKINWRIVLSWLDFYLWRSCFYVLLDNWSIKYFSRLHIIFSIVQKLISNYCMHSFKLVD